MIKNFASKLFSYKDSKYLKLWLMLKTLSYTITLAHTHICVYVTYAVKPYMYQ